MNLLSAIDDQLGYLNTGCGFNIIKENQKDCEESLVRANWCPTCYYFVYLIIIIYLVGKVKIYKGKMKRGGNEKIKTGERGKGKKKKFKGKAKKVKR